MKYVIELPEDVVKRTVFYREFRSVDDCVTTIKALEKAITLPKGHGDLVDLKSLDRLWELDFYNPDSYYEFCTIMECGRILVEADEEG